MESLKVILFNGILKKMIEPEIKEKLVSAFKEIDVSNEIINKIFNIYENLLDTNEK